MIHVSGDAGSFVVSEQELGEAGMAMMGPMATLAFFDAMLEGEVVARSEVYQGRPAIMLASTGPFEVGPDTMVDAKFWVDATTMLVEHMEVDLARVVDGAVASTVAMEADLQYTMDVNIPRDAFVAEDDGMAKNLSEAAMGMTK